MQESSQIKRVQKAALAVILGEAYKTYSDSLKKLEVETLKTRRKNICLTFAKRALKSEQYSKWFVYNDECKPNVNTRHADTKPIYTYKPVTTRTRRYLRSPLPYLTNLLNEHYEEKIRKTQ